MENNWIENDGNGCPAEKGTRVDVQYRDGQIKCNLPVREWLNIGRDASEPFWYLNNFKNDIMAWRLHKQEQSLDDALGSEIKPLFEFDLSYPQTSFKPSSEAQLRADEAARVNNILSEKLRTISDTVNKLTGKNFSVADIKLVKDLLESVEEYEGNK